jgi:DNA-binding CsgD family transcriptional regulator
LGLPNFFNKKLPTMQARTLSRRELEVLGLISFGMPYKAIADNCGITMDTVAKHLRNIYRKMGVPNNAAAVAFALRNGIIN